MGMWTGLAGLYACWGLMMLIHYSPQAGMKCYFLARTFLTTQTDAREADQADLAAHINIK